MDSNTDDVVTALVPRHPQRAAGVRARLLPERLLRRGRPLKVLAALAATTLAATLLGATPAQATGPSSPYYGRVIANALNGHLVPTPASSVHYTFAKGNVLGIICKVRGPSVNGNNLWYSLDVGDVAWVSARYVTNIGQAPRWCGNGTVYRGKVTASVLSMRSGPTVGSSYAGAVARGASLAIICKVSDGTTVNGNDLWYHLTNGRWVAAGYVANVGPAPTYC